ncbi:hypothetical protein O6H91_11G008400 [Diphasiastrum complanatum]|uniref:Uncharacterized protein n=1 Tax=Diphasiastrum complanatum TaxID=34168 RepID=A0ACC2C6M9_DIPCM|nr:hypothetical protein O6H91_11G008400 [Diphasiastrum complanatum]
MENSRNEEGQEKKMAMASGSWIILDAHGKSSTLEADKYKIMERAGLHARDLRILDPHLSYPSAILSREHAIVLNLEHVKAIITAEEVLLQNPANSILAPVIEELSRHLKIVDSIYGIHHALGEDDMEKVECKNDQATNRGIKDLPFEFRVLEVVLEHICSYLDARVTELETSIYPALDELTSKISSRNLDRVRKLKTAMTRVNARVQKIKDQLEQLLDDDSDMAEFFLTRKQVTVSSANGLCFPTSPTNDSRSANDSREKAITTYSHGSENDIEELELLLEAYFMRIDTTVNKLNTLREYTNDTEDYINIQIDNHRNQLIRLDLVLTMGNIVLSLFSLVAGIFGVNLPYTWNLNHPYMFKWVSYLTVYIIL